MNRCKTPKYRLRPFVETDIPAIVEIALQSTFHFSAEALMTWSKHDPTGINVAVLDSGEVVGVCACINHNDKLCFGGAFTVHEKYRDTEIGYRMFMACFQHAGERNFGANSPEDKVRFYMQKGGKVVENSWTIVEYEFLGELRLHVLSDKLPEGVEIQNLEDDCFESMCIYDRSLAGYDRKFILEAASRESNTKTLVAFKDGACVGYGMVKRNIFDAARVGPLYANDCRVAEVMLKKLLETMPDAKGLAMSTISNNLTANEFLRRMEIPIHDNLTRIYTKETMVINTSKIFAQFDVDFSPL